MRNLTPLEGQAIARYDSIAAAKHPNRRKLLAQLRASVSDRYDAYARAAPRLEALPGSPFDDEQGKVLLHCYESRTDPLDELKADILGRQEWLWQTICVYCGINTPGTVEHYLPRAEFPEYSVCAQNLLPACGDCNTTKGVTWRDANGRKLLHFYYDRIPEGVRWLFAEVKMLQRVPVMSFRLQRPAGLDDEFYRLIEAHYASLELRTRYRRVVVKVMSEAISTAAGCGSEPERLGKVLTEKARAMAKERGLNYWEVAAYEALATSSEFLGALSRGELLLRSPPPEVA